MRRLDARVRTTSNGSLELTAPAVGYWYNAPMKGAVLVPGQTLGVLQTLAERVQLLVPPEASGLVTMRVQPALNPVAVQAGDRLLELDPNVGAATHLQHGDATHKDQQGLVFLSPLAGRFYTRATPADPPFVEVGQVIATGQVVGLVEVMKTFNRISFGGPNLPAQARVSRIVPGDGDDIDENAIILHLEPA